jgi:hypothetical protein
MDTRSAMGMENGVQNLLLPKQNVGIHLKKLKREREHVNLFLNSKEELFLLQKLSKAKRNSVTLVNKILK